MRVTLTTGFVINTQQIVTYSTSCDQVSHGIFSCSIILGVQECSVWRCNKHQCDCQNHGIWLKRCMLDSLSLGLGNVTFKTNVKCTCHILYNLHNQLLARYLDTIIKFMYVCMYLHENGSFIPTRVIALNGMAPTYISNVINVRKHACYSLRSYSGTIL